MIAKARVNPAPFLSPQRLVHRGTAGICRHKAARAAAAANLRAVRSRFLLIAVCLAFPAFVLSGAPPSSPSAQLPATPAEVVKRLGLPPIEPDTALGRLDGVLGSLREKPSAPNKANPATSSSAAPAPSAPIEINARKISELSEGMRRIVSDTQVSPPHPEAWASRQIAKGLWKITQAWPEPNPATDQPPIVRPTKRPPPTPAELARADLNGDGKLSPEELEKFQRQAHAATALRLPEGGTPPGVR